MASRTQSTPPYVQDNPQRGVTTHVCQHDAPHARQGAAEGHSGSSSTAGAAGAARTKDTRDINVFLSAHPKPFNRLKMAWPITNYIPPGHLLFEVRRKDNEFPSRSLLHRIGGLLGLGACHCSRGSPLVVDAKRYIRSFPCSLRIGWRKACTRGNAAALRCVALLCLGRLVPLGIGDGVRETLN